ncbi:MAG: nicotinate (nicotinamide) nucleotide adenylyltransferase [Acidobacteria bacterium]|nr:nicotinate (nicotinamide) nucleotide adenylyltransferase [Acidobacteriota bacterium]
MNIGLFGGTFDPIHKGHLALARTAREKCQLGRVYFVPTYLPPHRTSQPAASYFHRYAMTVLATEGEKAFVPSLLEAPPELPQEKKTGTRANVFPTPNYSIDTIRRLKTQLKGADRLFFLIGIDAFTDIAKWHQAEALFSECEFVVASRPGYSLADVALALPEKLRPRAEITEPFSRQPARGDLVLPGVALHLLADVKQNISATAIRQALVGRRPIKQFVPENVEEYIKKEGLYKGPESQPRPAKPITG